MGGVIVNAVIKPLVSVIVPVYKVKSTLDRCVKSIVDQDYNNLEIILIDDGSPDNSGSICDTWAACDERITVIHQSNGGLSAARNAGLDVANGNYIAFVDSDDYINSHFISTMIDSLIGQKAQMAICAFEDENVGKLQGKKVQCRHVTAHAQAVDAHECFLRASNDWSYIVAWNKLYESALWSKVRFPEGLIHEDEWVFHRIVAQCSRIALVPDVLYRYTANDSGITHTEFSTRNLTRIDAIIERIRFFYNSGQYDVIAPTFTELLVDVGRAGTFVRDHPEERGESLVHVRKIRTIPMRIVSYLSVYQRIRFYELRLSPQVTMNILAAKQRKSMQQGENMG